MFRNRVVTVTLDKKDKDAPVESSEPLSFREKTRIVVEALDEVGTKMFICACVYIWLDTRRQVRIEQAKLYK